MADFDQEKFLAEFRRKPAAAFRTLMDAFRDRVLLLCLRVTPSRSEAEDLAQEAFLRIWRGLDNFRGESSLSTWIYHIVWNVCASHLEKKGRSLAMLPYSEDEDDEDRTFHSASTEDAGYIQMENRQFVSHLLENLSPSQKMVVSLFYLEEQSYEEIVRITGWPLGTVKANLHRAKEKLRKTALEELHMQQPQQKAEIVS